MNVKPNECCLSALIRIALTLQFIIWHDWLGENLK